MAKGKKEAVAVARPATWVPRCRKAWGGGGRDAASLAGRQAGAELLTTYLSRNSGVGGGWWATGRLGDTVRGPVGGKRHTTVASGRATLSIRDYHTGHAQAQEAVP